MRCTDGWGICSRCGRFRRIRRILGFAFEGSRFGCGPSVPACLGNRFTVLRTREAHSAFVRLAAAFAASLHSMLVALRFERAFAIGALVLRTREAHSAFVGRAAAFAASGLSTFGC